MAIKREQGLQLAFQYQQSGMRQKDFAQSRNVTVGMLRYWIWKSHQGQQVNSLQNRFVEVKAAGFDPFSRGRLWLQTSKAAMHFEQLPNAQYLVQLLNGIHAE